MKVLLVVLQKRGGGALDGLEFSNGLIKNRFAHAAVVCAGSEYADRWDKHADLRSITKIATYGSNMKSFLLWTATIVRPIRFLRAVIRERADIVHVVDFHPWAIFAYMARPFAGYKIFYAPQDNPFDPKEKPNRMMEMMERYFVRKADLVIAYSEFMKTDMARYFNKKIEVLPLGVHLGVCPGITDKKFHEKGKFMALFFGRIEPYKGLDILIHAAEIIVDEGLDIEFVIAGRGDVGEDNLALISKLKIDLRNRWVTDEELCSLVADADVLVAPYRKATQSGIISIGLACHVPLIGTDVGSFREYIKDGLNGLIVPTDPHALAEAIKKLYNNRALLREMSRGAHEVAERYSWANVAKKAIALYQP